MTDTLPQLLRDSVRRHPGRTSVEYPMADKAVTYRELGDVLTRSATPLSATRYGPAIALAFARLNP